MSASLRVLCLLFLFVFVIAVFHSLPEQAQQELQRPLLVPVQTSLPLLGANDAGVVRSRSVAVDAAALTQVKARMANGLGKPAAIQLDLFEDVQLTAVLERMETPPRTEIYIGAVKGSDGSQVRLVHSEGQIVGSITAAGKFYAIRYAGNEMHLVQEIDQGRLPIDAEPLPAAPDPGVPGQLADDGSVIDVMVVYTPAARSGAGGTTAMQNLINLGISETNTAYANSQIVQRFRLVHTAEVVYTENGNTSTDLSRLRSTTDGIMDEVHTLRDQYRADLVTLIINSSTDGACGVGYLMGGNNPGFASSGFNVVRRDCVSPNYSFGHELGHNQGLNHARSDAVGTGAFNYSFGFKDSSNLFRTVMAYNCPVNCPRVLHFSNPDVNYNGRPTGIDEAASNSANNALSLNGTRVTVANFRAAVTTCNYSIAPASANFPAGGGTGSITMTVGAGCGWSATANQTWITVTGGGSGSGNGVVNYSVAANTTTSIRTGSITIAGQNFPIEQAAGSGACPQTPLLLGQTASGSLGAGDCVLNDGSYVDLYSFSGTTGQQISISHSSAQFDAYLLLAGPDGNVIAQDDNGGGGANARIPAGSGLYTLPATGSYTIYANSLTAGETGSYSLGTAVSPPTPAGLQFYPLARPIRLLDTRASASPNACNKPLAQIPGGTARTQPARGLCDGLTIPANAAAITGNITTVQSGGGFLTLYPSDVSRPTVANSNYGANEILNNVFTVGLGASDGAFKIYVTTNTDVVVDVTGYYAPPGTGGLYFHPLPRPVRLLETRAGLSGCYAPGNPLPGATETTQQATGACAGLTIPSNARAIVGNATTVSPQGTGAQFFTLFPADAARPLVASSNYSAGQVMNAPFTVGLSSTGAFKIHPTTQTHLVIDVTGYYSPDATDANGAGLRFHSLAAPIRLLETRAGLSGCYAPGGQLLAESVRTQPARGNCGGLTVPVNAAALVGNATVVQPLAGGWLTFWPSDAATQPTAAASNYATGQIFNRHFIVGLGSADGAFRIYTKATTHLVIDLAGYFAP
ncbi:MAG: zinc-dependent metalloprotease family protein [Blastocatellia bacterium]|nr:zinc-dependent metalloprotease family protein [Blastocatellia bacterium]